MRLRIPVQCESPSRCYQEEGTDQDQSIKFLLCISWGREKKFSSSSFSEPPTVFQQPSPTEPSIKYCAELKKDIAQETGLQARGLQWLAGVPPFPEVQVWEQVSPDTARWCWAQWPVASLLQWPFTGQYWSYEPPAPDCWVCYVPLAWEPGLETLRSFLGLESQGWVTGIVEQIV